MIYSMDILIVDTICIQGNMGNNQIRGTFFVAYIGADYSWHGNYIKSHNLMVLWGVDEGLM